MSELTPEMNIASFLAKSAQLHPQHPAIVYGTETVTYAELYRRALSLGGCLLYTSPSPRD